MKRNRKISYSWMRSLLLAAVLFLMGLTQFARAIDIDVSAYPDIEFGIYNRLPDGTIEVPYPGIDFEIVGATGTESLTWSLNNISSPVPGVTINPSTGVLTIPLITSTATITFNVAVTDNNNPSDSDQNAFILHILRKPIHLRLVLDRSGSMIWCVGSDVTCPDDGSRRWNKLESGISLLMDKLDEVKVTGDHVGITYFHSSTNVATGTNFDSDGTIDIFEIPSAIDDVKTNVEAQNPSGSTAMGEGLIDGKDRLPDPADNITRLVLLFTDGDQNAGRLVQAGGTTVTGGEEINNGTGTQTIKIYPVAIFGPGGYINVLQDIAQNNNPQQMALYTGPVAGTTGPPAESMDFATYLSTDAFNALLEGNSPQLIDIRQGTIQGEVQPEEVFVSNKEVDKLLFQVVSADDTQGGFEFNVEKDGVNVSQYGNYSFGPGYGLFTINFPNDNDTSLTSEGSWKVRIYGSPRRSYTVAATADDHNFKYDYDLGADQFKVNDPFKFSMKLLHLGKPVTNATVSVTVLKPGDDLGHRLAVDSVNLDLSDAQDAGSVGFQKYHQLLRSDPDFVKALLPTDQVINLTHSGDGNYTGEFTGTDVSGVYQIIYDIKSESEETGTIERLIRQSVNIRFGDIDLENSIFGVEVKEKSSVLTFKPITVDGKWVGPAYGDYINISGPDVSVQGIIDNGDGSYTITVSGDPEGQVEIDLLDEKVYEGEISDFGEEASIFDNIPSWLLWLIIILIILIIIFRLFKKHK